MCNYTQREFHCGHVRWIVSRWCPVYTRTQRRCPPCVTHFEYRGDEVCGMSSLHGNAVLYPSFALGESIIAHSSTPGRGACFCCVCLLPRKWDCVSNSTLTPSTWNWDWHGGVWQGNLARPVSLFTLSSQSQRA
ncbi:hypothetical protein CCUS01_00958 [Colletotrichum cuscutae]|uniref:Uncharacterized protein n=1 Tax=Colletotrichum cuscutae TaxID=1209917 RepID=A0AAI9VAF2_9PEZI|nr:hypothetical protein CCUS01_00958 [Colletotrichum cuscutae]